MTTGVATNAEQPYCENLNVNVHNNNISLNSSTGDELFSGTPAGAGGVSICTGSDYYKFNYNWVCGNLSSGDGGGVGHMGFSYNGDIEHNSILFNQSLNPTIPANGGGLLVMGTPDVDTTCGGSDRHRLPRSGEPRVLPATASGPDLVINANLIMGNAAEAGSGGGLRLQNVNGGGRARLPDDSVPVVLAHDHQQHHRGQRCRLGWRGNLDGRRAERQHHQQHGRFQLDHGFGRNPVHDHWLLPWPAPREPIA